MISSIDPFDKFLPLLDGPERLAKQLCTARANGRVARRTWEEAPPGCLPAAGRAMEALAWAHAMPQLAGSLPAEEWEALLARLLEAASAAGEVELEREPLAHQLLAGELSWTLAGRLPDIAACRKLERQGRAALSAGLARLLDGEGFPQAGNLAILRPLLACWTRSQILGAQLPGGGFRPQAARRYRRLIGNALRLARPDGRPPFSNGEATCDAPLFDAAVRLGGDKNNRRVAAFALPPSRKQPPKRARKGAALPSAAAHSEEAAVAVLRRDWSRDSERLCVLYPDQSVTMELVCGSGPLWSGPWQCEIRRDDDLACPIAPWRCSCWTSDDDADYLELELDLTGGLKIQRHILLARKDRFLLLADAVLGDRPGRLQYRAVLPLAPGIAFQGARESREGFCSASRPPANGWRWCCRWPCRNGASRRGWAR